MGVCTYPQDYKQSDIQQKYLPLFSQQKRDEVFIFPHDCQRILLLQYFLPCPYPQEALWTACLEGCSSLKSKFRVPPPSSNALSSGTFSFKPLCTHMFRCRDVHKILKGQDRKRATKAQFFCHLNKMKI